VTGRKPPVSGTDVWIDAVIREARERGEFDNLPGEGKPLDDLGTHHDEMWWVRKKLQSEGISYLPPTLALRKDREETLERVGAARTERKVRELLEELNDRIRHINRSSISGPPSTVMPVDVEEIVLVWRERRAESLAAESLTLTVPPAETRAAASGKQSARRGGGRWPRLARKADVPKTGEADL
jgi:hypothetical protein